MASQQTQILFIVVELKQARNSEHNVIITVGEKKKAKEGKGDEREFSGQEVAEGTECESER